VGRAVAVIPDLDTPRSYEGLNRTLAMALGSAMGKTKDLKVSPPESVQEALRKVTVAGKMSLAPNIKALGDALGVQGIVLTGIMPPEGGTQGPWSCRSITPSPDSRKMPSWAPDRLEE
jgi:hypothetical protein